MQSFTDENGRAWTLRLDWAAMRRAKAAGVDLSQIESIIHLLHAGGVELIDALWACLDLNGGPVNRDEFERAVTGDTIGYARMALIEAVKDFFPAARAEAIDAADRVISRQVIEQAEQLQAALTPWNKPSTESLAASE